MISAAYGYTLKDKRGRSSPTGHFFAGCQAPGMSDFESQSGKPGCTPLRKLGYALDPSLLPSASHYLVNSSTGIQRSSIPAAEVFIVKTAPVQLTNEIELQEGEKLTLPDSLVASVGAGRWLISLQPAPFRDHRAFLNSYAPEDEGLYHAYPPR